MRIVAALAIKAACISAYGGFADARHVPERKDDFAFENDKVAFRLYGPALRDSTESSGIDCWLKRVETPVIDSWYGGAKNGKSYHQDHGEGYDPYHVGESLGCGGLALWIDEELVLANVYQSYRILENEPGKVVFEIRYKWNGLTDDFQEKRVFSLDEGSQLFRARSEITRNGRPAQVEVAVGVTTHDGKAKPQLDPDQHWIATWEEIDGFGLGTGVILKSPNGRAVAVQSEIPDRSHALLIVSANDEGVVEYSAGFAWERAGEIPNLEEWMRHLENFNP